MPSRTLHEEEVQIVGVGAVRGVGLDVDTVYSVVHVEVVDIDRTGERFQGREDIGHRQPQKLDLVTVRIEIQLRDVLLHSGGQSGELFPLHRIMKKRVRGVLEILIGRVPLASSTIENPPEVPSPGITAGVLMYTLLSG